MIGTIRWVSSAAINSDAMNPEGFRRFVAMVHRRGMKILA